MNNIDNKLIYLSYPIQGHEDTVFEHAENMTKSAFKLGLIPVSPLSINNQTKENIYKTKHLAPKFLGNDIYNLLMCGYIFMGKGWENSKGCKLEYYTALLYNKKIIFE